MRLSLVYGGASGKEVIISLSPQGWIIPGLSKAIIPLVGGGGAWIQITGALRPNPIKI